MHYYIKIKSNKGEITKHIKCDQSYNFSQCYKQTYQIVQKKMNWERVELWQHYFNKDKRLCTFIKKANTLTKSEKYDPRTGISFYSEI